MECDIYRSIADPSKFVFVRSGTNPLATLPTFVKNQLGDIAIVSTTLVLPSLPMVGHDANQVIKDIEAQGYYATGVKKIEDSAILGAGLGAGLLAISLGATPIVGTIFGVLAAILTSEKSKGVKK